MGLLDSVMGAMTGGGQPQRKPGLGDTVAAGVLLALAVKAARSFEQGRAAPGAAGEGRSFDPQGQASPPSGGGLGGMLGGLMGGGGMGGILSNLGGSGALGALIGRLQQSGLGQQANSWVSSGANHPVEPQQLAGALGEGTIQTLQRQTGMERAPLLDELAHVLPQAVDEATPQGRLPSDEELHQIARPGGAPAP